MGVYQEALPLRVRHHTTRTRKARHARCIEEGKGAPAETLFLDQIEKGKAKRRRKDKTQVPSLTVEDTPQLLVQTLFTVRCMSKRTLPTSRTQRPVGTTSAYEILRYCLLYTSD